jgi:hypothetical protein
MVCKGLRRYQADFSCDRALYWTVSGRFLDFLHTRCLHARPYEQSELPIFHRIMRACEVANGILSPLRQEGIIALRQEPKKGDY